ncbi:hypothetical protein RND59_04525 [Vibrio ruber]|uniref:hypothetical protein n=1 Tax=Vibrio ruber TaxID=184755 RepID=UPI002892F888|nr:hypothetical protein [Vibrio ruber]WNJ96368.1 hypothetical protein RND59_04525 [Vibrio ruber]
MAFLKTEKIHMSTLLQRFEWAIYIVSIFYMVPTYASGNLCDEIKRYINPVIEQSLLSEKIFGVERRFDEINSITDIDNVIGEKSRSYKEYLKINQCIISNRNRFLDRNSDLFKLIAIGMLNDKVKNEDIDSVKNYVLESLKSRDDMIVDEAVSATIALHDDLFVNALKSIVLSSESTITKKNAIDAIGSIYSQESRRALSELRIEFKNTEIEVYIDDVIYTNYQ